ncbi:exosome complex component MTR3-like isoform X2 [Periplaneta americana]|uniref:exosome complex component MTR3-like isoform X2 n=1 Tax=Periplaneta americana TaxID=6978 RepID=UPI0037E7F463
MPTDSRRLQGPENTTSYLLYVPSNKSYREFIKDIITKDKKRKDGRKLNEQRRIYMKTGVVSQAKGSAYIEQNNTKVICSVFDPREIPRKSDYSVNGELYCEFRFAPFSCMKWRGHQADSYEKECSLILRRALEPAVCRGIHGDMKFLDPTVEEESLCNMLPPDGKSRNHGIITAAFSPAHQQMSEFAQSGAMDIDCVTSSIQLLTETCESVYPLSQQCLLKSVTKMLKKKQKETQLNLSSDRIAL